MQVIFSKMIGWLWEFFSILQENILFLPLFFTYYGMECLFWKVRSDFWGHRSSAWGFSVSLSAFSRRRSRTCLMFFLHCCDLSHWFWILFLVLFRLLLLEWGACHTRFWYLQTYRRENQKMVFLRFLWRPNSAHLCLPSFVRMLVIHQNQNFEIALFPFMREYHRDQSQNLDLSSFSLIHIVKKYLQSPQIIRYYSKFCRCHHRDFLIINYSKMDFHQKIQIDHNSSFL